MRAGEPLMDGAANPHDILRVLGEKELAKYLVDEIQEVYRLQGVKINDKHIEVIVRQMLRRVRVTDVGDTNFLVDEQVEKHVFEEENERVMAEGGKPAVGEPLLLGITKASLSTESFISASSFQETTKVLTEAAVCGKIDYLRGPEGERDHGPADPGGHRAGRLQAPQRRGRHTGAGRHPGAGGRGGSGDHAAGAGACACNRGVGPLCPHERPSIPSNVHQSPPSSVHQSPPSNVPLSPSNVPLSPSNVPLLCAAGPL